MVDRRVGAFAAVLGLVMFACTEPRHEARSHAHDRTASVRQDLSATAIFGTSLAAKQLALSFDDGPGSRTLELSAYLKTQGIAATFFVNSQCFTPGNSCGNTKTAAEVLGQLVADGHIVANHTRDHKSLSNDFPNTPAGDAAIVAELSDVDAVIAPYVPGTKFMFRAPFGDYNTRVYDVLHASAMDKYVGHIEWDIGGARTATTAADWACWQNAPKLTSKACGDLYIQETNAVGKGIVLMHDADYGDVDNTDPNTGIGNTVDMVKYMVPLLEAAGYTWKRVDEVPAIAALFPPPPCDPTCATCTGPGANQCASCAGGRYLNGGACLACATCGGGQYQVSACTPTANTVCATCATCGASQYQVSACTATANTVCAACDATCATCDGPAAADCTTCAAGKWLSAGACATCTECAAGTYQATACGATSDTVCSACHASCTACSGPLASDCGSCPANQYLAGGECHTCTTCAAGSYQTAACSANADTACAPCPPGTRSEAGATACTACPSCDDGDPCTADRCDAVKGCTHETIAGCLPPKPDGGPSLDAGTGGTPFDDGSADSAPPEDGTAGEDGCSVPARAPSPPGSGAVLLTAAAAVFARRRARRAA